MAELLLGTQVAHTGVLLRAVAGGRPWQVRCGNFPYAACLLCISLMLVPLQFSWVLSMRARTFQLINAHSMSHGMLHASCWNLMLPP
jgi:hypothetical protein